MALLMALILTVSFLLVWYFYWGWGNKIIVIIIIWGFWWGVWGVG